MKKIIKINGPYKMRNGRKHLYLFYNDGTRRHLLYSRYLMEQKLGRQLHPHKETVDHIDRDYTNDDFDNLRIVPRGKHISEDRERCEKVECTCIRCGKKFKRRPHAITKNSKKGHAGPFCDRSCAAKYGTDLRWHNANRLPHGPIIPVKKRSYYKIKKKV